MATVYEHADKKGKLLKIKLGSTEVFPLGWNDVISSWKVEKGYEYCIWKDAGFRGDTACFDTGTIKNAKTIGWNDKISSWRLRKKCDDSQFMFDKDCEEGDQGKVRGNCNVGSVCFDNRATYCNTKDLQSSNQKNCLNFCQTYPHRCSASISQYCNRWHNVRKPFCRTWCRDNKGKCDDAAVEYCEIHPDNNDFCSCFDENARNALPGKLRNKPEIVNNRAICFSNKCADAGYVTQSMSVLTDACPKCIQSINFDDINVKDGDLLIQKINQDCNIEETERKAEKKEKDEQQIQENRGLANEAEKRKQALIMGALVAIMVILSISSAMFI